MKGFTLALVSAVCAPPVSSGDFGRLLVWVAVPAAILGAAMAALIKGRVLNTQRFRDHRPGTRRFLWVALADLITWAVLWPALIVSRVQVPSAPRGLWVFALMLVVALGYLANRYGFSRAFDPKVAGSLRGTLLAELFTILMPVLAVLFGLLIFSILSFVGV